MAQYHHHEHTRTGDEIAVIGMAGIFPGAKNIHQFWDNLKNGVESIAFLSDEELIQSGVEPHLLQNPHFIKSPGGVIADKDCFDAAFFDYTPGEAEVMDPQIRIFHQCTWQALENAGYDPHRYGGQIGIFAGASSSLNWEAMTFLGHKAGQVGEFAAGQLANKDFLCSRVAYKLDLKGPAVNIQTTCSTSLVAVHMACQAILDGDCHMALAGGVTISVKKAGGYLYQESMIQSPDGHCRAFDALGKGTAGGNGAGIVLLKSLENALEDRDNIHAIIRASAINNDGINKAGYTAPAVTGQAAVIKAALQLAETSPQELSYVETHGTATELGDTIEIEALKLAYDTPERNYCALGSVKTNIGHLDAAAGVAGLIKTIMALKNKAIPPSLHVTKPNPKIDFKNSPFYVNHTLKQWQSDNRPRLAGVSSFGIGGTNAHVILEEAPPLEENTASAPGKFENRLLLLSAKTGSALQRMKDQLADYLKQNPGLNLADAAYTLQVGRKELPHRMALVCSSVHQAAEILSSGNGGQTGAIQGKRVKRSVIFMFSGIGSQYVDMGLGIYQTQPVFRREMDRCFQYLKSILAYDFKEILYPSLVDSAQKQIESADLHYFETAQLALFIFQYSLAKMLIQWGIQPHAMIGYSLGEYTAACISGVFSLEDALNIIVTRGRLIGQLPTGVMLSVPMEAAELTPLLDDKLTIAIDNGPSCIVAGPDDRLHQFQAQMKEKRCMCIKLPNSHAIHSRMMEPILDEFQEYLGGIRLNEPRIPYISNATGNWISAASATSPAYWSAHLKETVKFADGIQTLNKEPDPLFIEIGAGRDLCNLLVRYEEPPNSHNPGNARTVNLIPPAQHNAADDYYLMHKLGQLWLSGITIDWQAFRDGRVRRRLPLPAYPFERMAFPFDGNALEKPGMRAPKEEVFHKNPDREQWFYLPLWQQSFPPATSHQLDNGGGPWLIFMDQTGLGSKIAAALNHQEQTVVTVTPGNRFAAAEDHRYIIDPRDKENYDSMFAHLKQAGLVPDRVIHLWNITGSGFETIIDANPDNKNPDVNLDENLDENIDEKIDEIMDKGFYSILYTVQAIGKQGIQKDIKFQVVTSCFQDISGGEELDPLQAAVLGPVKVIPLEYPNINCCNVDIQLPPPGTPRQDELIENLLAEFHLGFPDIMTAYRGNRRWVQQVQPLKLNIPNAHAQRLKRKGVYLITGGFGGMGFTLAQYLATEYKARLILVGRSPYTDRQNWPQWLETHEPGDNVSIKIREIYRLEEQGAQIMSFSADVSDHQKMKFIISAAEEKFGQIDGILHAAGAIDWEGVIQRRTRQMNEHAMAGKIKGTIVLHRIFKDRPLDFFALFSSLGNIIYKIKFGQVGYNAGNEFLDAFAHYKRRNPNDRAFSINWTDWKDVGMAVVTVSKRAEKDHREAHYEEELAAALTQEEGVFVFNSILGSQRTQVAVSTQDLLKGIEVMKNTRVDEPPAQEQETGPASQRGTRFPRPALTTPYTPPVSDTQKTLAQLWEAFFGIDKIGIHDDFFELGGDSLKAITLLGKIHKKMNAKLSLMELFKNPDIEKMARFIERAGEQRFVAILPTEKKEYYLSSLAQKKIYFTQQIDPQSTAYNMPIFARLKGNVDKEKIEAAFLAMTARHESFRTSFKMIEDQPVQIIHDDVDFQLDYREIQPEAEEQIVKRFLRPFDLSRAPILRGGLLKTRPNEYLLMVDMHHIVSDVVSFGIWMKEFLTLCAGKNPPPVKVQYKDFAHWQNRLFVTGEMDKQKQYWLDRFQSSDIPVITNLFDFPRPPIRNIDEAAHVDFSFQGQVSAKIRRIMEETGVTLSVMLLTLYNIVLHRYMKQDDIIIGVVNTGRMHTDLENVIGMFVNSYPLRSFPSREKTFIQLLEEVKNDTFSAFDNQDYPLDALVYHLNLKVESGRNPLFDVAFNLDNIEKDSAKHTDFEIQVHGEEQEYAKFDLTLYAHEDGEAINLRFRYSTQLFKAATVEKLKNYFLETAGAIADNTSIKLKDIVLSHDFLIAKGKSKIEDDGDFVL